MFSLNPFPSISKSQRESWDRDGFLLLKGAVNNAEMSKILNCVNSNWELREDNPHHVDVITGTYAGHCFEMKDVPPEVRGESYKLNNLFLKHDDIRSVALSSRIKSVLTSILGSEPLICNSLNFERGSQQDPHIDSWYMPSPSENGMVALSISLDKVDDNNGPIFYYPGSHKIPPYRFSDGRLNMIHEEFNSCIGYLNSELKKRDLRKHQLSCSPGDVFIWNGQLVHGGSSIKDFSKTRKSMVVHYWRASDVDRFSVRRDARRRAYLGHTLRGELIL